MKRPRKWTAFNRIARVPPSIFPRFRKFLIIFWVFDSTNSFTFATVTSAVRLSNCSSRILNYDCSLLEQVFRICKQNIVSRHLFEIEVQIYALKQLHLYFFTLRNITISETVFLTCRLFSSSNPFAIRRCCFREFSFSRRSRRLFTSSSWAERGSAAPEQTQRANGPCLEPSGSRRRSVLQPRQTDCRRQRRDADVPRF